MKLLTKCDLIHPILKAATEYECTPIWGNYWATIIEGHEVSFNPAETISPIYMLERLIPTAKKIHITQPRAGQTVDVYLTEKHIVVYSHSKGNHWNISGNHYFYFHDITTGEFISEGLISRSEYCAKPIIKERLLKATAERLNKAFYSKLSTNPID